MKKIPYETTKKQEQAAVEEETGDESNTDTDSEEENKEDNKKGGKKDSGVEAIFKNPDAILQQIKDERTYAINYLKPKWDKWLLRLKLYNNQMRSKDAVGDPLLFTIHQTVLASLYTDKLSVEFQGREKGDADQAENLTMLAQFDYDEMQKDQIDYDWDWDTCFFGWGFVLFMEYDRDSKTPIPEVVDPFTLYRDPNAISVNGDRRGRGAARFFGREMRMCKYQMAESGVYRNYKGLKREDPGLTNDPMQLATAMRQQAQGYTQTQQDKLTGDSAEYILWEHFTMYKGERWFFTVGNNGDTLVRAQKVRTKKWPAVKRNLFAVSHDWDGVSIPDLVEDKQRSRATLINLGLKGVRASLYPNYLYNNQLIKNKASLSKFEFNKFTGVAGNPSNAVAQIPRQQIQGDVQWILSMLDGAAQQATATPDIKQGVSLGKVRSATETAQISQGTDSRYGLGAKVCGWSEKDFWKIWYELYTIYFKDTIDKKVIRISGALGPTWHSILREDIIGEAWPDLTIESKVLSDAKRMNRLNMDMQFANQGAAMDPGFNKRFALKQQGKDMGFTTDEINRYLPKTYDEYEAEQENLKLDKNKMPKITMNQNHMVHIEMHTKAADTPAKAVHIAAHYAALYGVREVEALKPPPTIGPDGKPVVDSSAVDPQTGQPLAPMQTGAAPSPRAMAQDALQVQNLSPAQQVA